MRIITQAGFATVALRQVARLKKEVQTSAGAKSPRLHGIKEAAASRCYGGLAREPHRKRDSLSAGFERWCSSVLELTKRGQLGNHCGSSEGSADREPAHCRRAGASNPRLALVRRFVLSAGERIPARAVVKVNCDSKRRADARWI